VDITFVKWQRDATMAEYCDSLDSFRHFTLITWHFTVSSTIFWDCHCHKAVANTGHFLLDP